MDSMRSCTRSHIVRERQFDAGGVQLTAPALASVCWLAVDNDRAGASERVPHSMSGARMGLAAAAVRRLIASYGAAAGSDLSR